MSDCRYVRRHDQAQIPSSLEMASTLKFAYSLHAAQAKMT